MEKGLISDFLFLPTHLDINQGAVSCLELSRSSPVEARVGEVVSLAHSTVQKVGEAVASPLWAPADTEPLVVVVYEGLAHRLEVGSRHVTQNLSK